jgi:hypothetical protein
MDSLFGILCSIGLVSSLIEAVAVAFYFKSLQSGLLAFAGAVFGAAIPLFIYIFSPDIFFKLGFWLVRGQDVFGSSLFAAVSLAIAILVLGSILGASIALIVGFKFLSN